MAIVASGFSRKGPVSRKALAAVMLVATVILGAQTWHKAFRVDGNDLTSYLLSARALWDGQSPYGLETPFPYLYPLFLACVMVPLTLLPYGAAVIAWFAASVAALASVLKRWSRGSELAIAAAVLVTFAIIQNNLLNGQVNFFVVLCCALAVATAGPPSTFARLASADEKGGDYIGLAPRQRKELLAGAWLGVGIAVKLMPALLLVYFLVRRQFRAILTAAVTALVLAVAPALLLDSPPGPEFSFSRIAGIYSQYARDVLTPMTTTPEGTVLAYSVASIVQRALGTSPALWLDVLCAAAVLGTIVVADVRHWRQRGDELAAAAAYLVGIVLISPKSETHHLAFAIPAVVLAWGWILTEVAPARMPATALMLSSVAIVAAPFTGAAEGPMITAAMVLLIAALIQFPATRTPR